MTSRPTIEGRNFLFRFYDFSWFFNNFNGGDICRSRLLFIIIKGWGDLIEVKWRRIHQKTRLPLEKISPNHDKDIISELEVVKNFALFFMIFEVPQFFLARGDKQWVPRFLLLKGDTIRLTHYFLPRQKRLSWWKILHQTCVALQLSLRFAPCTVDFHSNELQGTAIFVL